MDDLKIKKVSTVDLVCEKMKALIQSGEWQIYEKIPSENEMAKIFGVNRMTVRMALQKLNTLGILETRNGEGTFVKSFDFEWLMHEMSDFIALPEMTQDVYDFRIMLETEALRQAVKKATDDEIQSFANLCEVFEKKVAGFSNYTQEQKAKDTAFLSLHDDMIEIHTKLCKISHNKLIYYAFLTARGVIHKYMRESGKIRASKNHEKMAAKYLMQICKSLQARDFSLGETPLAKLIQFGTTE